MSKKIIISFNNTPADSSVAIDYTIKVSGLDLVYPNGKSNVTFTYNFFAIDPANMVEIGLSLDQTINNTLAFLVANYSTTGITYSRVLNTIEILISINAHIDIYTSSINPAMSVLIVNIPSIETSKLKYFFEYHNVVGNKYRCDIYKDNYDGGVQEINGTVKIEKASVTNHLDPIRGGGISLTLEANKNVTLEDLYSENERDFSVKLYKNDKIIFLGYLNPDGVYQDYVRDEWRITLDCVDGLGAIANLSFVQDNGLHFTGKMSAMDIIYRCLRRTGIFMPINTSVNILYDELLPGDDVLSKTFLNADRFVRKDNDTIMSCEEVLKSILDIFKACITQIDAEWYIYKPNEIFIEPYVVFRRFDVNNVYLGNKTVNLNANLGSQIDNFYPHHSGGNQRIEIKGSVGAIRINYKYGFVDGLISNSELAHNSTLNYEGWIVNPSAATYLQNDPLDSNGFLMKPFLGFGNLLLATADLIPLNEGNTFKFKASVKANGNAFFMATVRVGSYFLNGSGQWVTSGIGSMTFTIIANSNNTVYGTFEVPSLPLPISGDVEVKLFVFAPPISGANKATSGEWMSVDLENTFTGNNIVGDFYTVERGSSISSIVKETQTVYNGDNSGVVYVGAIFQEDTITPTTLWSRKNSADKFPLLRIAAEEELRIAQRPTKIFRGDFYGYISYLSLIKINNIGYFMPIEYSYDTMTNITTCKQLELFVSELSDIVYTYTLDYGETVKPTIK